MGPIGECARLFSVKKGIDVRIVTGTLPQWIERAKQNGDLIFEGAEYMLNDFMRAYPGIVEESSITGLYARPVGILVRKGNPKGIRTLSDLAREGVKIMVVTQERMEELYGCVPGIHYNIVMPVLTGKQAEQVWKTMPELDAWITYESWHCALPEETDFVTIADQEKLLRITPVAIIRTSKNESLVKELVNFLKTDEAHRVFQQLGWK